MPVILPIIKLFLSMTKHAYSHVAAFFFFSFLFLSLSLSLCFFFAHNRRGDQVPVGRGQRQPAGGSLRVRNRQAAADHGHHKRQHWDRRERVVQRPDDRSCDVRRHPRLGHEQRDGWVCVFVYEVHVWCCLHDRLLLNRVYLQRRHIELEHELRDDHGIHVLRRQLLQSRHLQLGW